LWSVRTDDGHDIELFVALQITNLNSRAYPAGQYCHAQSYTREL
jgi:hypothetical protein